MKLNKSVKNLIIYGSTIAIIGSGIGFHSETKSPIENQTIETDYLIGAHRGDSSLAVENTEEAIKLANKNEAVEYIELDIRMSKDKVFFLSHDDNILSTKGNQKISEMTSTEINNSTFIYLKDETVDYFNLIFDEDGREMLKRFRSLNKDTYQLISLEDALSLIKDKKIILDLKFEENIKEYVKYLKEFFQNKDISNIIFQSDNPTALLYLKEEMPNAFCSILVRKEKDLDLIEQFDGIGIRKNIVDKDSINEILSEDKTVLVWTIKSKKDLENILKELEDLSEDIIYITDYPDIVKKILQKK